MNRRQGILAVLCNAGAWMTLGAKPASAQTAGSVTIPVFTSIKTHIELHLDEMDNDAFVIRYKGREVNITAEEIMDALEKK